MEIKLFANKNYTKNAKWKSLKIFEQKWYTYLNLNKCKDKCINNKSNENIGIMWLLSLQRDYFEISGTIHKS